MTIKLIINWWQKSNYLFFLNPETDAPTESKSPRAVPGPSQLVRQFKQSNTIFHVISDCYKFFFFILTLLILDSNTTYGYMSFRVCPYSLVLEKL